MQRELLDAGGGVDAVFFCACAPKDACECAMPNPGMLLEIASRLRIPLDGVPVIGSTMKAMDAALAAGARPVFVSTGKDASAPRGDIECFDDLAAAVDGLLSAARSS
jgi:D-glycero-D-manno-heptose 1,7-bisphosphate phosphatase